tara:strand:- start:454 stop:753 length:300 start_codon:yes stop_codon:yes gene_type:complete
VAGQRGNTEMKNQNTVNAYNLVPKDHPNREWIETLAGTNARIAIPIIWQKEDADQYQEDRDLPPLTDDQWCELAQNLEKSDLYDWDWEVFGQHLEEVLK